MSVLPILRWPDARLAQVCAPVAKPAALGSVVRDMFETMYDAPGRGLAAPQIGLLQRFFVMDPTWKEGEKTPYVCINPEIVSMSKEKVAGEEACLSIPGVVAEVERASEITLRYQGLDGAWREERLGGFAAICAQHEYDHLDGRVIFDRVSSERRRALETAYEAGA